MATQLLQTTMEVPMTSQGLIIGRQRVGKKIEQKIK